MAETIQAAPVKAAAKAVDKGAGLKLLLSSSPHIALTTNSRSIMIQLLIGLTPCTAFGVILFGLPALAVIVTSIASAMVAEFIFRKITKQDNRLGDLTAVISGLLLALVLPPTTPLWMVALGAFFAIIVAKEFFGGLGANVFNPALIGRAFLLMSFPAAITSWANPSGLIRVSPGADVMSSATPLNVVKLGGSMTDVGKSLYDIGLSASPGYGDTIATLFMGTRAGCIGETSILLILLGGAFLLIRKIIDWRQPLAMMGTAFIASALLGMDPLFALCSGGLVFGAVFMATDYVSAPVTSTGKLLFGAGAGLITVLIRKWGNYPEGTSYAILIMNTLTPFLNRLIQKKYGFVPKPRAPKAEGGGAK